MSRIGDILTELREDRGLTQKQLGYEFHMSNTSISAYETGARVPGIEVIIRYAKYFDVTADYILGLTSSSVPSSAFSAYVAKGATVADCVRMLTGLSREQKDAVVQMLESMAFYTDITQKSCEVKHE